MAARQGQFCGNAEGDSLVEIGGGQLSEKLSQQKTRPIACIQRHLHSAVLLDVSCIDRMHDIDGNETHLARKSASSGRRKIPLRFH